MLGALIFWIIVGLIAGALAKFVMPGDDPGGFIWTTLIATIGAIILLAIYRAVAGGRATR